jgi:Ras-related protein Rab-1A
MLSLFPLLEQMKWLRLLTSGLVPAGRFGHSFHTISEDEILLFGGFERDLSCDPVSVPFGPWKYGGRFSNDVFIFNVRTLEWRRPVVTGDVPIPTAFHASCVNLSSKQLVVHGGFIDSAFTQTEDSIHVLDLNSFNWKRISTSGQSVSGRACHALTCDASTGSYFLFGDDKLCDNKLYEYDSYFQVRTVEMVGTCPLPRRFLTLEIIASRIYCFGGQTSISGVTDVYVHTIGTNKWSKPLYEGSLSVRAQAGCVLSDKLMIFGGVKEKASLAVVGGAEISIAKKLFFLNVLEIRDGQSIDEANSFKFKIVTVGDSGVGKSCLLTRFVADVYSDFHISTIGVDYKTVVTMVKGRLVKLLLWDTAGQERFSVVTGNYYRNADGFVIVYDATNRTSFDHVDQWMNQIKQHHECGPNTVKILCANKHDMVQQVVVSETEGRAKAEQIGAVFVPTSAKTSSGVDMAFLTGAQKLVEIRRGQQQQASRPSSPSGGLQLGRANLRPSPRTTQNCCA